jgi:hypothetical protein
LNAPFTKNLPKSAPQPAIMRPLIKPPTTEK